MATTVSEGIRKSVWRRLFFSLRAWVVWLIVAGAGWGGIRLIQMDMQDELCQERMLKIYAALERYEIEKGKLPTLAFFPDDPQHDKDSPLVVLEPYGAEEGLFVCPALPDLYDKIGLAYVWNTALNSSKLADAPEPVWMIVEISALSSQVPPPHFRGYNILYTDGTVRRSQTPPRELTRY